MKFTKFFMAIAAVAMFAACERLWNSIVNENKVKRINKVLEPIMEMMKDKPYAVFLELIPEPETHETEAGETVTTGMSYSDVALLMTQFKGALNRYFQKVI